MRLAALPVPALLPRQMPVIGNAMAPTLPAGSQVSVVPTGDWHGDAVYILQRASGPDVCRVRRVGGWLTLTKDGGVDRVVMLDSDFADAVLGIVVDEFAGAPSLPRALCTA